MVLRQSLWSLQSILISPSYFISTLTIQQLDISLKITEDNLFSLSTGHRAQLHQSLCWIQDCIYSIHQLFFNFRKNCPFWDLWIFSLLAIKPDACFRLHLQLLQEAEAYWDVVCLVLEIGSFKTFHGFSLFCNHLSTLLISYFPIWRFFCLLEMYALYVLIWI